MKQIIDRTKSRETFNELTRLKVRASNSLLEIQELVDIPCSEINTLTKAFIGSFVAQKIAEVSRTTFLTSDVKTSLIADWKSKEKTAIKAVSDILTFVEACQPQTTVTIENGELVTSMSFQEIADSQSLMEVPDKASEHFELIQAVRESIKALRKFEDAEDLRPMNMGYICNISENEVCQAWANGRIKIDHSFDHLYQRGSHKGNIIFGRD